MYFERKDVVSVLAKPLRPVPAGLLGDRDVISRSTCQIYPLLKLTTYRELPYTSIMDDKAL